MPTISQWGVEVDVELDVDVAEFYDDCSDREKKELAGYLAADGFFPEKSTEVGKDNIQDIAYKEALDKLYSKRLHLSLREEQYILNLANKY